MEKLSKFKKGAVVSFIWFCTLAAIVLTIVAVRQNALRITYVIFMVSYLFMLFSCISSIKNKDDGAILNFAGFQCVSWATADVGWVSLNGFKLNETMSDEIINRLGSIMQYVWLAIILLVAVLSLPLANKFVNIMLGNANKNKSTSKIISSVLGGLFGGRIVVALVSYLEDNISSSAFSLLSAILLVSVFWLLEGCSITFLLYKLRNDKPKSII